MGRSGFCAMYSLAAAIALLASVSSRAAAQSDGQASVQDGLSAWALGDYSGATRQWQGPAAAGDADAQFLMAEAYKEGRGVAQDLAKAELLYGKAARQGHMQAADVYGLLLFDRGQRSQAMPYVRAAAERGEPRAQYLLGLAHFNGDLAAKDWVRAYALVSLAQQAGLPRATAALAEMDKYISLEQRQAAAALSAQLDAEADATLARQMAEAAVSALSTSAAPAPRIASPRTAGADYARPAVTPAVPPQLAPRAAPRLTPRPAFAAAAPAAAAAVAAAAAPPTAASGVWRVQLGAFGVAANADALWHRLRARLELAGHPRINAAAGGVIKLQAGGFASQDAAKAACARLASAGVSCLAVR